MSTTEQSAIEWTHWTFNPWRGCTKVSDGCKFCYADQLSSRNPKVLGIWGKNGTRSIAAESYWNMPLKWNAAAKASGKRQRVFCASLADVGEGQDTMPPDAWPVVQEARKRLGGVIDVCDWLDFLLLTKRPENMPLLYPKETLEKSWVGTSIENQEAADKRMPHLGACPAGVRFLSCEPLLGPVDLGRIVWFKDGFSSPGFQSEKMGRLKIDWVIIGCESRGKMAGRFADGYADAAKSLIEQCRAAGVPVHHKQMPINGRVSHDMNEWPDWARVREFPAVPHIGKGGTK